MNTVTDLFNKLFREAEAIRKLTHREYCDSIAADSALRREFRKVRVLFGRAKKQPRVRQKPATRPSDRKDLAPPPEPEAIIIAPPEWDKIPISGDFRIRCEGEGEEERSDYDGTVNEDGKDVFMDNTRARYLTDAVELQDGREAFDESEEPKLRNKPYKKAKRRKLDDNSRVAQVRDLLVGVSRPSSPETNRRDKREKEERYLGRGRVSVLKNVTQLQEILPEDIIDALEMLISDFLRYGGTSLLATIIKVGQIVSRMRAFRIEWLRASRKAAQHRVAELQSKLPNRTQ